jgi:hypothetical protein
MFTTTARRFRRKGICAAVAAAIASVALAGAAFAVPNDSIGPLNPDPVNNNPQFGTGCSAGAVPSGVGNLDWNENAAQTTIQPKLTGDLCLQGTTNTYRVALELYFTDGGFHSLVSSSTSLPATGNGAALNAFAVNLNGPKLQSAAIHHAHIQIQRQDAGGWTNVGGAAVVSYP